MTIGFALLVLAAIVAFAFLWRIWRRRGSATQGPNASNNWQNPNYTKFVEGDEATSSAHVPAARTDQNFTGGI